MNSRLKILYKSFFAHALDNSKELSLSSPLLLKIDEDEYNSSDIKIMIIGQETYGWYKNFGDYDIDELMEGYDKYLNNNLRGKNKRAFWKGYNYFKKSIEHYYKIQNKKTYCMWNNLIKIGKYANKGMSLDIRKFEREYLSLINDEIKILKPDIVIFLTGPQRDKDIIFNFSNVSFKKDQDQFIYDKKKYRKPNQVIADELPTKSIRLYHPNYFGGFNKTKDIALEILKKID